MTTTTFTISTPCIPFRIRCRATLEQTRMMHFALRSAWESRLANEWRDREFSREVARLRETVRQEQWREVQTGADAETEGTTLVLHVAPNDDAELTCLLCGCATNAPPELCTTFLTPHGSSTAGLHRRCYERAMVPRSSAPASPACERCGRLEAIVASARVAFPRMGECNGIEQHRCPKCGCCKEEYEHGRKCDFWRELRALASPAPPPPETP